MGIFNRKKKQKATYEDFPNIGALLVSKMVTEEGMKPLFIYREKRTRPEDSGWRIFSGFESPEYTNDPNNIGIYAPSTILDIEPGIRKLLLKGVGSVFERESYNSDWYEVFDYPLEDDYIEEYAITNTWTLYINNLFERIPQENGDLLFTTGDKSVRITSWNDNKRNKNELFDIKLEEIKTRDQSISKTLNFFDFSGDSIKRVGYEIIESEGEKSYHVIYAFSIVDQEILQLAFYFDSNEDRNWALETWKEIKA